MHSASEIGPPGDGSTTRVTLSLKESTTIPIEASNVSPDKFVGLTREDIAKLPVLYGRRELTLGDLFTIDGEDSDHILLHGDLSHAKHLGRAMSRGLITIQGKVGMHLGAHMSGGKIVVHGDAGAWAGAQMSGGLIRIHGSAGPMLGAVYTGERLGMRGGAIVVDGSAGPRAAERMRRGIVVVQGNLGDFAGARMIAGSLFTFGTLGARPGAGMKRGTLLALGGLSDGLLPTFRYSCTCEGAVFVRFYLRRLRAWGLSVSEEHIEGTYHRYTGDVTALGKGEVFIYDQRQ